MAKAPKKEAAHVKYSIDGVKVTSEDFDSKSESIEVIVPKGIPYAKVRKALEIALLRIR